MSKQIKWKAQVLQMKNSNSALQAVKVCNSKNVYVLDGYTQENFIIVFATIRYILSLYIFDIWYIFDTLFLRYLVCPRQFFPC